MVTEGEMFSVEFMRILFSDVRSDGVGSGTGTRMRSEGPRVKLSGVGLRGNGTG